MGKLFVISDSYSLKSLGTLFSKWTINQRFLMIRWWGKRQMFHEWNRTLNLQKSFRFFSWEARLWDEYSIHSARSLGFLVPMHVFHEQFQLLFIPPTLFSRTNTRIHELLELFLPPLIPPVTSRDEVSVGRREFKVHKSRVRPGVTASHKLNYWVRFENLAVKRNCRLRWSPGAKKVRPLLGAGGSRRSCVQKHPTSSFSTFTRLPLLALKWGKN